MHVRRAISYSIDRAGITRAILLRLRQVRELVHAASGAVLRPEVAGDPVQPGEAKAELAKSKFKNGFTVEMLVGAGATDEARYGQVIQQALKALKINSKFRQVDTSTEFTRSRRASTSWHSATGPWTSPTRTSS